MIQVSVLDINIELRFMVDEIVKAIDNGDVASAMSNSTALTSFVASLIMKLSDEKLPKEQIEQFISKTCLLVDNGIRKLMEED